MKLISLAALLGLSASGYLMADDPQPPSPERIHRFEVQKLILEDFRATGYILDIGGGGEAVIGQLKPAQVIAIDISKRELEEAPAGPLKIVMDATDLKFLDNTFPTATAFFSLMYMKPEVQEKTFQEVFRVLRPGGRFLVWDLLLPARSDPKKDIAVVRLEITLPHTLVKTGYGTFFPAVEHDLDWFKALARKAGFKVEKQHATDRTFCLEMSK